MSMISFQNRVRSWAVACFGLDVADNRTIRNYRFLEEALELVQAIGCTKDRALALVEYVYERPAGDPRQEVGGVMVTLAALCAANELPLEDCAELELERCYMNIAKIRAKQAAKNARLNEPASIP
jgi:hypothetical protein